MIKNEIIAEINIKDNNSKEGIINSFENEKREKSFCNLHDSIDKKKMKRKLKNAKYIYQ